MADRTAYPKLGETGPKRPLRGSTVLQMWLYLLMPVASWFGDVLIDGVLQQFIGLGG